MDDDGESLHFGHGSINETGGEFQAEEHFALFNKVVTNADFFVKSAPVARSTSTKKNTGRWEVAGATIEETFKDGPICLNLLARKGVFTNQHDFLIECSTFFRQKYPENWEEPMRWVNMQILHPPGDQNKLKEIIRTTKDKPYFYRCKQEPISSHCMSGPCKFQKYGVGNDKRHAGLDMKITKVNRIPAIFFVGDRRMRLTAADFGTLDKYRLRCLEYGITDYPIGLKHSEWIQVVTDNMENATEVEPSPLYRQDAEVVEALERYFTSRLSSIWQHGNPYLTGQIGEDVRIRMEFKRVYFKHKKLMISCELFYGDKKTTLIREFIDRVGKYHHPEQETWNWGRSKYSLPFSVFDEDVIDKWLNPDKPEEDSGCIS